MEIKAVMLEEVLNARERRAAAQRNLIKKFSRPVVSFSMNIAGEIKNTPIIEMVFRSALEEIEKTIDAKMLYKAEIIEKTGPEALFVFDQNAETIKEAVLKIENCCPVGRLLDIDVIKISGEKISRGSTRACLVCGGPVTVCSRNRVHGLEAVKNATQKLLLDFVCEKISNDAVDALLEEARLSPKPGLVDSINNGSHKDMDLPMLCRSAAVLRPYFADCVRFGAKSDQCIDLLQEAGIFAEKIMLEKTGGVNTHKGAIFAMGVYLGALGGYLVRGGDLFLRCKELARKKNSAGFSERKSHGELVRIQYKGAGALEEAMNGFPTARIGADALAESGRNSIYALLKIMQVINDTNLLYRGGQEALLYVQKESERILQLQPSEINDALLTMDEECIKRNISPGGAADMLALAILISKTS